MATHRTEAHMVSMVREFCKLPQETPWLEFKQDNTDPQQIGEYISALSNAAALCGRDCGYMLWGIDNLTHEIVGTSFKPGAKAKGNEDLETWLLKLLNPRLLFSFHTLLVDDRSVVMLEVPKAAGKPTSFHNVEYTRVGSHKKPLKDFPEQEKALWRAFDQTPFEELAAATGLQSTALLELLDFEAYFSLLSLPVPSSEAGIVESLRQDRMIKQDDANTWSITNLGAILFARDLHTFKGLARKAVRLVVWEGRGRFTALREREGKKGYASGFEGLISYLSDLLPRNEVIGKALRHEVPMYPDLAVRELIANAIIHQDFSITGAGPMVEVFEDRMEITNPGSPLVNLDRLLDSPPRSRNEALASFMRRAGVCEERGSGVDRVVKETEFNQLPAPVWELHDSAVRVSLFAHRPFNKMSKAEKVHACYLHACLRYVMRDPMTNTSLRERFGIEPHNSATASRIIRDTLDANLIKPHGEGRGKNGSYAPAWA